MDDELQRLAAQVLSAAPASVEMPAGAGKTHLLAAAVTEAATRSQRSLILTHTNAGVDAIRKRLQAFGVRGESARVETITSWAFSLVGAYPALAGISVSETPDWTLSDQYVEGAARVVRSATISEVHTTSFDFLFVDEYQDCTLVHHAFVLALADAIPTAIIFGDRLQAIFGFAGELANWEVHVQSRFPAFDISPVAQRWKAHNQALGEWLLQIRPSLAAGQYFDLAQHSVPGLTFSSDNSPVGIATVAHSFTDYSETVVLLDKWPKSVAGHASRLGGSYSVMEDISGNFMREQISGSAPGARSSVMPLPQSGDPLLARWLAQFAKACVIGLGDLNHTVLQRLDRNQTLEGLSRDGIQSVVDGLESLRSSPTYAHLIQVANAIRVAAQVKTYRWEAWNDTLSAIALSIDNDDPVIDNFGRVRERLRRQGRRNHARVASRTLLVKGLEYDHVIIANLSEFRDPRNLYVALSRARRSVTIIGGSDRIQLRND